MSTSDKIPPEYQEKLNGWKDSLKKKWDYERKLMIFEGSDGQKVYFTTTTTTTTTLSTPAQNVTWPNNTTFSSVVVINTTDPSGAKTAEVAGADTSKLITIVGITCASLLALLIILLIFVRLCRRSSAKRKDRISLRRPLNPPEPEEHIYAEIEPLQRSNSPGGASGNSGDIQLPQKKHRKRGVSSVRALSTRIYRFFSQDHSDNQSVFYNRNEHHATVQPPPTPPDRNSRSPKRKRGGVKRFESTASRRALLDGDSQVSNTSSVELRPLSSSEGRNNIYNPLLRESESRQSGPYDCLASATATAAGEVPEGDPESPHDYFTLEKKETNSSPRLPGRKEHLSPVAEANSEDTDSVVVENETLASAADEPRVVSSHDYFILHPHEKENDDAKGFPSKKSVESDNSSPSKKNVKSENGSPSKNSVKSDKSPTKDLNNGSVHKTPRQSPEKGKPVAKPRASVSPAKSNPGSPSDENKNIETMDGEEMTTNIDDLMDDANYIDPSAKMKKANYIDPDTKMDDANYIDPGAKKPAKDDIYVLSKLGKAPEPPKEDVDGDYLSPLEIKKSVYVDVLPNPPPRTTSLHPEEPLSPKKQQSHESTV